MAATRVRFIKNTTLQNYYRHRHLFLLMIPGLVLLLVFKYAPMYGVIIAFKKFRIFDGIWGSEWVGFDNFIRMFNGTSDFGRVLRNTVMISLLKLLFIFPAPIILAILLNEIRSMFFKRIAQTISYLPHFLSWVIVAGMLQAFLSPSSGIINHFISMFGGDPIYFMTKDGWFLSVLVASDMWKEIGWGSIVYLAAIAGIDPQLYDSAKIDGAGRWGQAINITLPSIINVMVIMLILSLGKIMNAGFDQIFNLYNPAVYDVSDILDTYVYRVGLVGMDYSFSTAVGVFKSVIGIALVLITNRIAKWFGEEGIL